VSEDSTPQQHTLTFVILTATTAGGLLPLWFGGDPLFVSMAVAILFGLVFATVLTLGFGFVPALYQSAVPRSPSMTFRDPVTLPPLPRRDSADGSAREPRSIACPVPLLQIQFDGPDNTETGSAAAGLSHVPDP